MKPEIFEISFDVCLVKQGLIITIVDKEKGLGINLTPEEVNKLKSILETFN